MRAAASLQGVTALCGTLKPARGCIFLAIDPESPAHAIIRKLQSVYVPIDAAKFQQERDSNCFHCTVIHPGEMQAPHVAIEIEKMKLDADGSALCCAKASPGVAAGSRLSFDILGIGSNAGCWFAILSVPEGDSVQHPHP
jgi:hypothetical protein